MIVVELNELHVRARLCKCAREPRIDRLVALPVQHRGRHPHVGPAGTEPVFGTSAFRRLVAVDLRGVLDEPEVDAEHAVRRRVIGVVHRRACAPQLPRRLAGSQAPALDQAKRRRKEQHSDDARITLENAMDARALGALVLTHAGAVAIDREGERVVGATVEDRDPSGSGRRVRVRARVVVNAGGPWSDKVRALVGEPPILRPTKGVHLVLDEARLKLTHAVVMQGRRDQRVMFAIPWGSGRTVIGTTDTDFTGDLDRVFADAADVEYLLETTNHYFPEAKLSAADVLSTWAGLRPLIGPPSVGASESDTSREHQVIDRPGFITIAGGKLTTFRRMAAEVVDCAGAQLGRIPVSTTGDRPLPGAVGIEDETDLARIVAAVEKLGYSSAVASHLVDVFGSRAVAVARRGQGDASARAPLDPEQPVVMAQVDEAVDNEFARTLDDVLCRRCPLILRARDQGLAAAPAVADRMARRLGWSAARTARELVEYSAAVADSRRFRG